MEPGLKTKANAVKTDHANALAPGEQTPRVSLEERPGREGSRMEFFVLHGGFLLTGAYTTLLGTALPMLTARWNLHDSRAGTLFLAQFLGSMSGAFLKGLPLSRMIALGFAVIALCAALLGVLPGAAAPAVLFLYGCGLGVAMTSTSVRIGQVTSHRSGNALASLNAVWAAGAGIAPWLLLPWMHRSLTAFLLGMTIPAALAAGAILWVGKQAEPPASRGRAPHASRPALPFPSVLLLIFLSFGAVGVETALGGWMTTYIGRAGLPATVSTTAASCFWFGLLGSRLALSLLLTRRTSAVHLLLLTIALALAAASLLLRSANPGLVVLVALLCGCGVGPLYPLVLERALALLRGRAVFAIAGLGAALVPLLTGLLSGWAGSLRIGLLLPLSILLLMFLSLLAGRRGIQEEAIP